MNDLCILGAHLADKIGLWDVGIKDGKISVVEPKGQVIYAKETINADGLTLLPGIIDAHIHARDPGFTHKEDFKSATMAAANGGVTTVMAMPNSNPPATTIGAIRKAKEALKNKSIVDAYLAGGVCAAFPSWIDSLISEEVIALDVFDNIFSYGTKTWIETFKLLQKANIPICFYLMDNDVEQLRKQLRRQSGASEIEQIIHATSGETEAMSIARIFPIAAYFDVPVVIRMLSTADGLKMVRLMRNMYPNAKVYAEVCVHYLFLTSDNLKKDGSSAHIHPPLRTQQDVDELWVGVKDGTVDYISSDHAPHAKYEKNKETLSECGSGMVGLETMLPLLLDACHKNKIITADILRLCCENPAKIFGLSHKKGTISVGLDADLVLIDESIKWTVDSKYFYTKGAKSPFEGWRLWGKPLLTISKGKKVMVDGAIITEH